MAVLKCKMCGGDMEIAADKTFGTCEYCGSTMTLPRVSDDQRAAAFNRGNHFRRTGEFDKALAVYERIVAEDDADAEAHWCCALCRFGIEYVEDPATYEWLPTCHRASFDSFLEDVDYQAAVEYSDGITKRQYQKDAARIAEVQRGILATSQNEAPFDVFICYKESDENGERTRDSIMAQDIYYQLTEQGKRVFFARITLEDKAGTEYEPYIFAALNSARVMVVVGTKAEYFNAVWVKNEWSRFLSMMKRDRSKLLLPCYKDMDPYDLPEALSVLQSYDMSKIGFVQDLLHGINKVLSADAPKPASVKETVIVQNEGGANVKALLQRGNNALEDEEWDEATDFFNRVLDMDAECAEAYLGLFLAEEGCSSLDDLDETKEYDDNKNWVRAKKYAVSETLSEIEKHEAKHQAYLLKEQECQRMEEDRLRKEEAESARARNTLAPVRSKIAGMDKLLSAGHMHTVGLKANGAVLAVGQNNNGQCDVSTWRDIIAVSAGECHTVGLKADGTVVATKYMGNSARYPGQCEVASWRNIVAISAGSEHTVGLKADGTVVATQFMGGLYKCGQCEVLNCRDIIAVSAGECHTVGLKADGTVIAVGNNTYGECEVSNWRDIVAVSAGMNHTVGLKADGTVVATQYIVEDEFDFGQCEVSTWRDIVAVSAGDCHTVGLKADGTVVAVGDNYSGECEVSNWRNVVAISAGCMQTIGLKADGTVIATKHIGNFDENCGQCEVSDWKLFERLDASEENYTEMQKMVEDCRKAELNAEKAKLESEYSNLKGLFSGKRKKEIEARLAEIGHVLNRL